MSSGSISNEVHKSIANGISIDVNANTSEDFANVFHTMNSSIGKLLNTNEMMFVYLVIRSPNGSGGTVGSPYFGFIVKASPTIILGTMFSPGVSDKRLVKFRDNTADSAATYTIVTLP